MQDETLTSTFEDRGFAQRALGAVSPSATDLIRMDHTKVLAAFHRYRVDTPPATKQALANTICLLIEIHAALEEEIFYPAMREADPALVEKSVPEHDEMRRLMAELRTMDAASPVFDDFMMSLMRIVMHHVADEETLMLPQAERVLAGRLKALGASMTSRKIELGLPRLPEFAVNAARALPASRMLVGAAAIGAGVYLFRRAFGRADKNA
jgi:hypothetical protein